MSDTLGLGKIIETSQNKDAIHVAVAPVFAAQLLRPGQHVGFKRKSSNEVEPLPDEQCIGIVDPFLRKPVYTGQRFWMFLYPYTITSLRHDWTHPAFEEASAAKVIIENDGDLEWLHSFAEKADLSYGALIEAAYDYLNNDEYLCQGGKWEGFGVPEEFWVHFEAVTGRLVLPQARGSFFSCSC